MSFDLGLKDVHVLITGASGGIGSELTKSFLQLGSKVSAHYNSSPKDLTEIKDHNLRTLQADVKDESAIVQLFKSAEAAFQIPVQVLIVNHGIWENKPAEIADMTLSQWRNTHSINLDGAFLLCREFLKSLRGQSSDVLDPASICFIGSTAGKFGEADHGDYASTKSALMYGLTLTLKNEIIRIAPKGRVNSVNPGWVKTPMAEAAMKDEKTMKRSLATTPLQKVAMPSDVARQVIAMSSPTLSGHVTGVSLSVDGGMEGRSMF